MSGAGSRAQRRPTPKDAQRGEVAVICSEVVVILGDVDTQRLCRALLREAAFKTGAVRLACRQLCAQLAAETDDQLERQARQGVE